MDIDQRTFLRAGDHPDRPGQRRMLRPGAAWLALAVACSTGGEASAQVTTAAIPLAETGMHPLEREPPSPHLSQLFGDIEASERFRREIRDHLGDAQSELNWLPDGMEEFAGTVKQSLDRLSDVQLAQASLVELFELDRRIGIYKSDLDGISDRLTASASLLEDDFDRLEREVRRWKAAQVSARERGAPAELSSRIDSALEALLDLKSQLVPQRDGLLRRLNLVSGSRLRIAALQAEIAARRMAVGHQVRTAAGVPLWETTMTASDLVRTQALVAVQFSTRRAEVQAYWHEQRALLATTLIGLFLFSRLLLMHTLYGIRQGDELPPREFAPALVRDVVNQPNLSSLAFSILGLAVLAPKGPAAFYDWSNFTLPVAVLLMWYRWRGRFIGVSLAGFAVALLPILFWSVLELLPLVDRWVMLCQVVVLGACLAWDYFRGNLSLGFPEFSPGLLSVIVNLTLLSLLAGMAANALGYVGFARTAIWATIASISDTAVFGTVGVVCYTLGVVMMYLPWTGRSHVLRRHRATLLDWLRKALLVGIGLVIAARIMGYCGLYDGVAVWLEHAMQWQIPVGDGSVSLARWLAAAAILLATWVLMRCLQLVFEEELFPRVRRPLGIPFAVSAFARYLTALIGLVLAMSTLGLDLTRVTLVAGALGVGIGFGLQNIFNNFASGLILLVERPINVGDVIEVGKLTGTVRRIGIRSSTIRTPQGAEVILPNAELIAQPVLNWTLSDRLRRMEIDFAANATGETVESVIALLESAARESPDILVEPPPYALFSGFGDGNLNFRLCAWINRYEDESRIASAVRRAILARFDAVGIPIPNPLGSVGQLPAATSQPDRLEPAARAT